MHDLFGVGPWIMDFHFQAVLLEFVDDIDCAGVADIGAVFFEGDSEHEHFGSLYFDLFLNHEFDNLGCDIFAHIVVEPSTCEDYFGVVAILLCFLGEVVGIDADTVTSDKTRFKGQKIPLCAGSFKHFVGVDTHAVEDHGQFVDEGDVDVALRVFNHFGRFGNFDG